MVEQKMFDAVLPLKFIDFKRFDILDASLKRFVRDLRKLFIIVPDKEVELFQPRINDARYEIIPETAIVPEFNFFRNYAGWNKQQLIKLAAAEIVETNFYLTLDADIICVQPTGFSDLVKDGRSFCYKHGLEKSAEMFKQWYRDAERVLKIAHAEYHHDVTPAVLSKQAMLMLHDHLTRVSRGSGSNVSRRNLLNRWLAILTRFIPIMPFAEWRLYLLRSGQWTEYSLYYAYLEAYNLFEKYHFRLKNRMSGNSVWELDQYDSWDPSGSFSGARSFHFTVVQSNTRIDPDEIWRKVRPYLQEA